MLNPLDNKPAKSEHEHSSEIPIVVSGRPKKWTKGQERKFVEDMASLLDGASKQEVRAAAELKAKHPVFYEGKSPEELRKLFYKLRPPRLVAK